MLVRLWRGMDLAEGDYLVGMEIVEEQGLILSISQNGFGKRTKLTDAGYSRAAARGLLM